MRIPAPREHMTSSEELTNAANLFKTIERAATLVHHVTGQIEHLIFQGELQPGNRLPPERELARQFGVSRTVVRESVRSLVARGLLEVHPGSGTVISSPSADSVAKSLVLFLRAGQPEFDCEKVMEIRRVLEIANAGLAARRRTTEDLQQMAQILRDESEIRDDRYRFAEYDVAFHAAVANATHNELLSLLLDSVADILLTWRQVTFDVPGTPARAVMHHRAVYEQVKAGDPEGATNAMREHLIESENTMRRAIALNHRESQEANGQEGLPARATDGLSPLEPASVAPTAAQPADGHR
jgi:GntR family transcriptional repressor for pyruvate dehydrogenase complex